MSTTFESIILLHQNEAREALEVLENKGASAALEYLKKWHEPGEGTLVSTRGNPWKESDELFEEASYVMYYDKGVPYIGLVARISFD